MHVPVPDDRTPNSHDRYLGRRAGSHRARRYREVRQEGHDVVARVGRTGIRATGAVLAAVLGAASLAGCSSTGGKRAEERAAAAEAQGRAAVNTPKWTFAMVTHSGDGDTFWDIVQKGAEQAAVKDNINFLYAHSDEGQQQAQLVQSYIDKGVDGLIVTLAKPDAMKAVVAKATKAGIPVITVNSGSEQSKQFGALTHIGQDESIAGEAVGDELDKRGRKKALCVLHEQGNVGHEQRCAGAKKTFDGTMQNLYVDGTNMPDVQASIEAKLQADKSIDAVVTLGAPFADTAVKAKETAGSNAEIDTFDLNEAVAGSLKAGRLGFAVDQQPYLQGYEAVDLLWLYRYNADVLGGGLPVLTGPQIISEQDAAELEKYAERGTR
ncbi:sugar ABC transporter substrate-binding protein [Streptomyces sp. NP-1717]|nr:sugar ABC transporter substrate-binding protein [Streptomyces sp. NP-1717]